ncbi:rCG57306 [Rattus norvegicus]|uniref:RCG57306 n=1 Tax=Rattus norvegicus TaxID=10116 RepID=A6JPE6_RAT|nr:rCG57306 [Rattus norvegicus]
MFTAQVGSVTSCYI